MKELIEFLSNQGCNFQLIWNQAFPFIFILLLAVLAVTFTMCCDIHKELDESTDLNVDLMNDVEEMTLKLALKDAQIKVLQDKLSRFDRKRNEKGQFIKLG